MKVCSFLKFKEYLINYRPFNTRVSAQDMEKSEQAIFKFVLKESFSSIKDPSLKKLAPYVDSQDEVGVGGRIQRSRLPDETKRPIVLPKQSLVSLLLLG